jgi:hypothetical protein
VGVLVFFHLAKVLRLGFVVHKYAVAGLTRKMLSVLVAMLCLGFAPI